jgi:hypothetical protein
LNKSQTHFATRGRYVLKPVIAPGVHERDGHDRGQQLEPRGALIMRTGDQEERAGEQGDGRPDQQEREAINTRDRGDLNQGENWMLSGSEQQPRKSIEDPGHDHFP